MEWLGPTLISAIVVALGWFVSHRNHVSRLRAERTERVTDVQTALRAEIRSNLHRAREVDLSAHVAQIAANIRESPQYTPFVPKVSNTFVYDVLVTDIHVLPTGVIDPVVLYYRQAKAVAQMIDDLRGETYRLLDQARKIAIYED
jgi:hypothetical protein